MGTTETGRVERGVGRTIDYVRGSERRRLAVVVVVSLLFLVSLVGAPGSNLGLLPVGLAIALCLYLYTRSSARATVAASIAGPGVLYLGIYVFQVYSTVATASSEPLVTTLARLSHWLAVGLVLVVLGVWLHRTEYREA